ncbi:MAG TPA: amino acid adenylation domain-containing protein [Pyrinomonadaceae bacterium]
MNADIRRILEAVAAGRIAADEARSLLQALAERASPQPPPVYPLSKGQEALWIIHQQAPQTSAYNLPLALKLHAGARPELVAQALRAALNLHPVLRMNVKLEDAKPVQYDAQHRVVIEDLDMSHLTTHELTERLRSLIRLPFDLERDALHRIYYVQGPEQLSILLFVFHHLITDGVSSHLLIKSFIENYESLLNSKPLPAPAPASPYQEFVRWQHEMLASPVGEAHRQYWIGKLLNAPPSVLDQLADRPRSGPPLYQGESVSFELDRTQWEAVQALGRQEQVGAFSVVFAAFVCLLYLYTKQEEICVAVPVEGRPKKEFENTVGFFVNTIVLRTLCSAGMVCRDLLKAVYRELLESEEHVDYPFMSMIEALRKAGKPTPQFNCAFYFQKGVEKELELLGRSSAVEGIVSDFKQEGEFDFAAEVIVQDGKALIHFKFEPELFERSTVERLADHYLEIIGQMVLHPERQLQSFSLLTRSERELLERSNLTDTEYPLDGTVADLILAQARRTPDAIALIDEEKTLTYAELAAGVERLAEHLRNRNVAPGSLVAIFLERRAELVLAMLAIHRAGCAYVPLDPNFPEARISFILEDAGIRVLLTEAKLGQRFQSAGVEAILVDGLRLTASSDTLADEPRAAQETSGSTGAFNDRTAYVLYTSGSTGTPKGVEVSHGNLLNFLHSMAAQPGCTGSDHLLALTTVCFDIAGLELLLPLTRGGKVEIASTEVTKNGLLLREKLEASGATIVQATPATWQMLLAAGWTKRLGFKLLCGGEALTRELADKLLNRVDEVWNMYGPTETTIWSSASRVRRGHTIDIGSPIANTRFYLLDENQRPVPFSARGELYIAGYGVARGYWRRPELTDEKFLADPFRADGSRMYKTGDLARFLPNGAVEHLGRLDSQVKIRGFRVELGEIEATLLKSQLVEDAKILLREDFAGHSGLVAFVTVAGSPAPALDAELKQYMRRWLPDYMVPSRFVFLKSFPLTPSYKVDAKLLKEWAIEEIVRQFGSPGAAAAPPEVVEKPLRKQDAKALAATLEEAVAGLFEEDLRQIVADIAGVSVEQISMHYPLGEYGFDSIRFTTLSVRLNERFEVAVDPTLFYQHPKLADLAAHLRATYTDEIRRAYDAGTKAEAAESGLPEVVESAGAAVGYSRTLTEAMPEQFRPVAVIGVGAQLPGGDSLEEFWSQLEAQQDLIRPYPEERGFSRSLFAPYLENGSANLFQGSFISDVSSFDAPLFRISPREASQMDPQQRLLLQAAWQAMEDAGYAPSAFSNTDTGVFVGLSGADYFSLLKYDVDEMDDHFLIGTAHSIASNRISYLFNLQGPSATFDTACSSSLVAVHRAVRAIQDGVCETALAGGANLILSPYAYLGLRRAGMLSDDSRCKTFDERANGYGRGEGVGLLLLKRLDRALADNDPVHAVIIGSAENHGGRTHSLTVPNPRAQAEVLIRAYESSDISPDTISYIETHGTGTQLGDPIEVNGIKEAFAHLYRTRELPVPEQPHIALGSVKTNIGHLEAAAGVAGVIKVLLAMKHRTLPGLVHFSRQNKMIDLTGSPFYLQTRTGFWEPLRDAQMNPLPRRAGVSSFGMGGSNAHLVLEEPPARVEARPLPGGGPV